MPRSECDASVLIGSIVVFTLPLTLLIPDFSLWDFVPKIRVTRWHVVAQGLTMSQLSASMITLLVLFFCLYLEVRKRKLDDMVETVLTVSQATDKTMEVERERQAEAVKVCVDLLDASAEHYENLVLLREELRQRTLKQQPPGIELSDSLIESFNNQKQIC